MNWPAIYWFTDANSTLITAFSCSLQQALNLIPAWISNHMISKVWDEIAYPFPNFNGCTVEVWEWISNFISHFIMDLIALDLFLPVINKSFNSLCIHGLVMPYRETSECSWLGAHVATFLYRYWYRYHIFIPITISRYTRNHWTSLCHWHRTIWQVIWI